MELSPHLIAHTDPVSNPKAQVVGKGFRITVLTDRLFRVETSKTDTFIDEATQGVWFRNFEVPTFSVNEGENYLTIRRINARYCLIKPQIRQNTFSAKAVQRSLATTKKTSKAPIERSI